MDLFKKKDTTFTVAAKVVFEINDSEATSLLFPTSSDTVCA